VHSLASPLVLALERRRHLWLSTTETGCQNDVAHRKGSLLRLAVLGSHDGHIPLVGLLVEGGALRVDGRFRPDIDLKDIDVRFQEIGKLAGGCEDWPVGREGVEGKVVGVYGDLPLTFRALQ